MTKKDKKAYDKKYRVVNAETIRTRKKKYRLANTERIRIYNRDYCLRHKDKTSAYMKVYQVEHADEIKIQRKEYRLSNPEKIKGQRKTFLLKHTKRVQDAKRKYYLDNYEKIKKHRENYYKTPGGKASNCKHTAKRKQLGFIPLNSWFEGSDAHHIDKDRVIYIPKKIHRSIYHKNLGKETARFIWRRNCLSPFFFRFFLTFSNI